MLLTHDESDAPRRSMHILILGAGAMGSLLGARLSGAKEKVTLLSTNRGHIRAVRENGLLLEELDGSLRSLPLPAHDDPCAIQEKADLVIVAVKTHATRDAISAIKDCCHSSTVFLTLQNGIGNLERIADLVGAERVLVGITAQGCTFVEPGRIRHGGNGATFIGEPSGPPSPRVKSVVETFRRAGMETRASDCMDQLIWHKLLINVGINAITALTGIRNGSIAELEPTRELCGSAVAEAVLIARAKGFLVGDDMVERVISVARATALNRSSMGQDVDRRKRTEIDAINGAIVRFGEQMQIPVPVNRTLTQLIKTLEATF